MMYLKKWCIYSEHSGNHIVSLCDAGTYQCDCIGWTRHMPRRNCKHIYQVIDENPKPLNRENWDNLRGKKKKLLDSVTKMMETETIKETETNPFTNAVWKGFRGVK